MKLEGTLQTFPLRELIEMVVYSSVTGVLNIFGEGTPGHLYFRDGVLYHIEHNSTKGFDAMVGLFELRGATFAFVSDLSVEEESLRGELTHHLQNAERIAVRWRQVRAYVPTLDLVPLLIVARETALSRVGVSHHEVLAAIDGQTSLRQIAASMGWAEIDTAEAIVQMTVDGMIELRSQPTAPATEAELSAHNGSGIFKRALARPQVASPRGVENAPSRPADTRTPEELILDLLRG